MARIFARGHRSAYMSPGLSEYWAAVTQFGFLQLGSLVTRFGKYVNMADIISDQGLDDEEIVSLIELLFFAYRDFTSDPDAILAEWGFGRAHHRVVHFVGRNPGMTVAQLLSILGITKQSLGRVLRDLIERDLVYQRPGELDRRQRLLFLTNEGEALRRTLMAPQARRIVRALGEAGDEAEPSYRNVLYHLINPENRKGVSEWLMSRDVQARKE